MTWPLVDERGDVHFDAPGTRAFRFDYRVYANVGTAKETSLRWVINQDNTLSFVFFGGHIWPQYIADNQSLLMITNPPAGKQGRIVKSFPVWSVTSLDSLKSQVGFTTQFGHYVFINIESLVDDLRIKSSATSFDQLSNVLKYDLHSGSRAEIHLTRERGREQFPIKSIVVFDKGGSAVCFSRFHVHSMAFPSNVNRLWTNPSDYLERRDKFAVDTLNNKAFVDDLTELHKLHGNHPGATQSGDCPQSGRSAWEFCAPKDKFSSLENDLTKCLLSLISNDSIVAFELPIVRTWAINALKILLTNRIVEAVRVRRAVAARIELDEVDPKFCTNYIASHERWRAFERLEYCGELGLAERVISTLADVATNRDVTIADRVASIDAIGELGIPPMSYISDSIRKSTSVDACATVRIAQATMQARLGRPTQLEIDLLISSLRSDEVAADLKLLCLEALLLSNRTSGQESLIESTICDAGENPMDLKRRCLFAAGASHEGRLSILKVLSNRISKPVFRDALFLAESCFCNIDSEWSECLNIVESIAIDRSMDIELRIKASEIARYGQDTREFRDKFIRLVLASDQFSFLSTVGRRYLTENSHGERYCFEFDRLFSSFDAKTRDVASLLLLRSCGYRRLSPGTEPEVSKLLDKMVKHSDPTVRICAIRMYGRFRRAGNDSFLNALLPSFGSVLAIETDPKRFVALVREIERSLGRELADDLRTPVSATEDEVITYFQSNRRKVQDIIAAWIRPVEK